MTRVVAALLSLVAAASPSSAQEPFDLSAYEKKPLEWKGYLELTPEVQLLRRDSAGYLVQFPGATRSTLERASGAAELSALLRRGSLRADVTAHASWAVDARGDDGDARFHQAYVGWQPGTRFGLELGKRVLRWGKGYAFSPVAFLERSRDPTDPDLPREGFILASAEAVRSFDGPLRALSLAAVALPTAGELNAGFGPSGHVDVALKLYALVLDTDVDLVYKAAGAQGQRLGADVSRNLGSNVELHGEWALTTDAPRAVLAAGGALAQDTRRYASYLLGVRYLTAQETTLVLEYFHDGAGYAEAEMRGFFALAREGASDPAVADLVRRAAAAGYGRPNAMRDYAYGRISHPEPFDMLYFTPSLTAIVNLADGSFSIVPEVVYTRSERAELRLRLAMNAGDRSTEYGEKPVRSRLEVRARLSF